MYPFTHFVLVCLLLSASMRLGIAQTKYTKAQYIAQYAPLAVKEMKRTGIPASITLAQGILESGIGNSLLARKSNNHFGIKCHKGWTGKRFYADDDAKDECFRVYTNVYESYIDHSNFLQSRSRYAFLFDYKPTDYKSWAYGLKKAGYATNPSYPQRLIQLIEDNQLAQYDKAINKPALAGKPNKPFGEKETPHTSNTPIAQSKQKKIYGQNIHIDNMPITNTLRYIITDKTTTLKALAKKHNVKENRLRHINYLDPDQPIPSKTIVYLQKKKRKGSEMYHHVREKESMQDIAQLYGIDLIALYKKNHMTPNDQAIAGELIHLQKRRKNPPKTISYITFIDQYHLLDATETPSSKKTAELHQNLTQKKHASTPAEKQTPSPILTTPSIEKTGQPTPPKTQTHIVQDGDTLYRISKQYNISVQYLKEINGLKDNNIKLGQRLLITP